MEKIKYITNRELLLEIHKSKNSYCYYEKPEYSNYDAIVNDLSELTPEFIEAVYNKKLAHATKKNLDLPKLENLVFRHMTTEHIPEETDTKKRKRNSKDLSMRTCFPPFKHYIIKDGVPIEVGRSHWKDGAFSAVHGKMTNRLAHMLILLVERYSRRNNWRSYCVDETTQALTQRGWLSYDEITEKDFILSYKDGNLIWSKIKSIFKNYYSGKMFHLTIRGMDALVTPRHKFLTTSGFKEVEFLLEKDKLILLGDSVIEDNKKYDDNFVEIVGWAATESCFYDEEGRITISQNEGLYAERIRKCLDGLEAKYSERYRDKLVDFILTKDLSNRICDVAPNRVISMEFILSLSSLQRELLINTMIDADGWRSKQGNTIHVGYSQKDKKHLDAFLALCTISGYRTTFQQKNIVSFGKETDVYIVNFFSERRKKHSMVENIDFHGGKNKSGHKIGEGKIYHQNYPTKNYSGMIWCPETEYGSFVARRNCTIFLTGNSYNDEMRGNALLQLADVALLFNESKSDTPNPFAFYTTIIKHQFTRILNNEKKVQHIRDDLLIMCDKSPSHTRLLDNEIEQRSDETKEKSETVEKVVVQKKRGRKPKSPTSS